MSVTNITSKSQYDQLVKSTPFVAIQAHATWCGPCKAISPFFAKLATAHARPGAFSFARFDTDEVPELAAELGISTIPAFFFFQDGDLKDDIKSANPKALQKMLEDMADRSKARGGTVSSRLSTAGAWPVRCANPRTHTHT